MNRIKELRKELGWNQEYLGERLGVQKAAVSKYETGAISISDDIAIKIATIFNVSLDYLFGITNNRKPGTTRIKSDISYAENYNKVSPNFSGCLISERSCHYGSDNTGRLKELITDELKSALPERLGISKEDLNNLSEYGLVSNIQVLVRLAEIMDVSVDYLLNRTDSALTVKSGEDRLLKAYRNLNEDSKIMALSEILKLERDEPLVAAKDQYRTSQGKSYPSSGTEG